MGEGAPKETRRCLTKGDRGTRAETEGIGAKHEEHPLGRVVQIERGRPAQAAGAHRAELTLPDVPAIVLRLRWRTSASTAWHLLTLPIRSESRDNKQLQVAWLGELVCGMTRNITAATLLVGVEAEVSAQLVDGSVVTLGDAEPIKIQVEQVIKKK